MGIDKGSGAVIIYIIVSITDEGGAGGCGRGGGSLGGVLLYTWGNELIYIIDIYLFIHLSNYL
jgi:hypothetical protein